MTAILREYPLAATTEIHQFRQTLLRWFARNGRSFPWRHSSARTYVQIVSEVLLQRTQAHRVATVIPEFISKYPSWHCLAKANRFHLRRLIEPLGLWRRRTITLLALAREMNRRHGRFPRAYEEIIELPGIGQYIANAILLFAHRRRFPLIDVNMARVLERNFGPRKLVDIRYDQFLQSLAARVVSKGDPIAVNWAILDLAALLCTSRAPRCSECPLASRCRFGVARLRRDRKGAIPTHQVASIPIDTPSAR